MKRTLLCTLCSLMLSMLGVTAWGQSDGYHIPNGDFSKWKDKCGSTYQTSYDGDNRKGTGNPVGLSQRPGVEPDGWNGSNINQTVIMNKQESDLVTSDATDKHVLLTNKYVGVYLGIIRIGSNAPAYITFGTPWVYAVSDVKSCDGGTYGGTDFKGRPDAIKGIYKRTAKKSENAYVIAYLWSGTFKSDVPCSGGNGKMSFDDVDKAVLGKVTATSQGKLVASCEKSFATTENNDWETIEVPLEYEDEAAIPEKMNVIISGADYWTRGNIKAENILEVKNVEFVYYHYLSSCKYDGQNIVFDKDSSATVMAKYDESKLSYEKKGVGATVEKSYDETTGKLTITVKGDDYVVDEKSVTTYTIRFVNPEEVVSSKEYTEDLYVSVNGMTTDPQATKVSVQTRNDGKINFVLKNFMLVSGDEAMPIGNIEVLGLEKKDNVFTFNGNIEIVDGDLEGVENWFGPMLGEVPLDLKGEFVGDDHLKVAIDIDMRESIQQVINVHLGYTPTIATMAVKEGRQYGTFYAPFDVTLPSGVKAYTCEAMEANGYTLKLTPVDGTIAAKTAIIVEASEAVSQKFYNFDEDLKVENGSTGYLYGVAEGGKTSAPLDSYVLQTQNGSQKFYLVTVENGDLKVEANRCYLQVPADKAGVKAISFPGDATAIDGINALVSGKTEIYDLQGRRLPALQKGINVVNGRKVMVK